MHDGLREHRRPEDVIDFHLPAALLGLVLLLAVALAIVFLVASQVVQTP